MTEVYTCDRNSSADASLFVGSWKVYKYVNTKRLQSLFKGGILRMSKEYLKATGPRS